MNESKATTTITDGTGHELEATDGGGEEVAPSRGVFSPMQVDRAATVDEAARRLELAGVEVARVRAASALERSDDELDAIFRAWPEDKPLPADARLELEELTKEIAEAALSAKLQGRPWTRDELKAHARRACALAIARHLERLEHPLMTASAPDFAPVAAAFDAVGIKASIRPLQSDARAELRRLVGGEHWRGFDRLAALERIVAVYGDGELSEAELDELVALRLAVRPAPAVDERARAIRLELTRVAAGFIGGANVHDDGTFTIRDTDDKASFRVSISVVREVPRG